VVPILILIALPLLINVNRFRPKVESQASDALAREVTVGDLSLSLFSGRVEANNIVVAYDPAFSTSPFVTAKSLNAGADGRPAKLFQSASMLIPSPLRLVEESRRATGH
jgi:AsmA protein